MGRGGGIGGGDGGGDGELGDGGIHMVLWIQGVLARVHRNQDWRQGEILRHMLDSRLEIYRRHGTSYAMDRWRRSHERGQLDTVYRHQFSI